MSPTPLAGLKVLEFAGLAPGPYAGMLLSDSGASVLRVDRAINGHTHAPASAGLPSSDPLARRKHSIAIDLKSTGGRELIKSLTKHIDVIIDPFRPGVLEKLGLGPDVLCELNPRIIYGRMTGFRRDGKYAAMAGHDINYLAVSGVLNMLGRSGQKPFPPINILGDFAGGGAVLFQGILLALVARQTSGKGQVVEANMVDGSSHLASFPRFSRKTLLGDQPRGENVLDGGCPWYDTYETRDGKYMSVGSLEPQFFDELIRGLGLEEKGWKHTRYDRDTWPEMRTVFEATFKAKDRREWESVFDGTDACCVPVLDYAELEQNSTMEGDQRPIVALMDTPMLGPGKDTSSSLGQPGYVGQFLGPGHGGEQLLHEWVGWSRGREFDVEKGGLVLREKLKL